MRAPVAEKLAELRAKIGRIPPFKTPRKGFTPKQRAEVKAAYDGRCAGCDEPLKAGWEIDHIKELCDEGAHEPANWQPLCGREQNGCHQGKTSKHRTTSAKADRCRKRDEELPEPGSIPAHVNPWPPGRKMQSRPFFRDNRKERA